MGFYGLNKQERAQKVAAIRSDLEKDLAKKAKKHFLGYFADEDTYIRKAAYQACGRIYFADAGVSSDLLSVLSLMAADDNFLVRQTAINAAGEIGMKDFHAAQPFLERGLFDAHHSPRNAVIGCIKKMGEKNPAPVLRWSKKFLHHKDPEVRRQICHGIELRGRTHPEDILDLLRSLEDDRSARVRSTLVHVIGQIAYKEGCLPRVLSHLKTWRNREVVARALDEIADVHRRYSDFAALTAREAIRMIDRDFAGERRLLPGPKKSSR